MNRIKLALFAATLGGLCGCATQEKRYDGMDFQLSSAPPADVELRSGSLSLPTGIAVRVSLHPRSSDLPFESSDQVEVVSKDKEVLQFFPTGNDREVFLAGNNPGETCLEIRINQTPVDCVPVSVSVQQAESARAASGREQ